MDIWQAISLGKYFNYKIIQWLTAALSYRIRHICRKLNIGLCVGWFDLEKEQTGHLIMIAQNPFKRFIW